MLVRGCAQVRYRGIIRQWQIMPLYYLAINIDLDYRPSSIVHQYCRPFVRIVENMDISWPVYFIARPEQSEAKLFWLRFPDNFG